MSTPPIGAESSHQHYDTNIASNVLSDQDPGPTLRSHNLVEYNSLSPTHPRAQSSQARSHSHSHSQSRFQSRNRSRSRSYSHGGNNRGITLHRAYPLLFLALLDLSYTIYTVYSISSPDPDHSTSISPSTSNPNVNANSNSNSNSDAQVPWRILLLTFARIIIVSYVGITKEWRRKAGYVGATCGITLGQAVWEGCSGVLIRNSGGPAGVRHPYPVGYQQDAGGNSRGRVGEDGGVDKQYLVVSCLLAILEYLIYLVSLRLSPPSPSSSHPPHAHAGGNRYRSQSMRLPAPISQTHLTPSSMRYYSTTRTPAAERNGYTPSPRSFRYTNKNHSNDDGRDQIRWSAKRSQRSQKGHSRHVSRATMRSVRSTNSAGHLLSPTRNQGRYHYGAIDDDVDGPEGGFRVPAKSPFRNTPRRGPILHETSRDSPQGDTDTSTAESVMDVFTSSVQPGFIPTHGLNRRSVDRFHTAARDGPATPGATTTMIDDGYIHNHNSLSACEQVYAGDEDGYDSYGEEYDDDDDQDGQDFVDGEYVHNHYANRGHGHGQERAPRAEPHLSPSSRYGLDDYGDNIDLVEFEDEEFYTEDEDEGLDDPEAGDNDHHDDDDDDANHSDDYSSSSSSISESSIIDLPPPLSPAPLTVPPTLLPNMIIPNSFPRSTSLNIGMRARARSRVNSLTRGRRSPHDQNLEAECGMARREGEVESTPVMGSTVRKTRSGLLGRSWGSVFSFTLSPNKGRPGLSSRPQGTNTSLRRGDDHDHVNPDAEVGRLIGGVEIAQGFDGETSPSRSAVVAEVEAGAGAGPGDRFVFPRPLSLSHTPSFNQSHNHRREGGGYGTFQQR
ncbi:hypothetical protein IAT40_006258 [Kwoniella sp. CBS 6097]